MELLDAERTGYVDWDSFTRVLLSLAPKRLLRADVSAFMDEQVRWARLEMPLPSAIQARQPPPPTLSLPSRAGGPAFFVVLIEALILLGVVFAINHTNAGQKLPPATWLLCEL